MDKKIMGLIILGIICILCVGYLSYAKVSVNNYQLGFKDATLMINKQIISNIIENGQITIYIQNQSIRLIPEQTCIQAINQTQNKVIADCQNYIKQMERGR